VNGSPPDVPGGRADVGARVGILRRLPATWYVLAGNVTLLGLTFCTGVISTRYLGPEGRGELSGAQSVMFVLAAVLTLGIPQAIVPWRGPVGPLRSALMLQVAGGGVVALGVAIALWQFDLLEGLGPAGCVGAALIVSGGIASSICAGLAQRSGHMSWTYQWVRVAPLVLFLMLIAALIARSDRDADHWILALGVSSAAVAIPGVRRCFVLTTEPGTAPTGQYAIREVPRAFVRAAAGAWVVSLGAQVVYRLDAVLVALFLSAEKVGLYSVALASAGVVFGAGTSVGMIFFSRFDVDAPAATRLRELRRGVRQATLLSAAVVAPMFVLMPQLVRILYGAPYADSVLASRILVLASIALCVDYLLMHAAIKMGEARAVQRVQLGVCLLSVTLLSIAVATGSIVWVATVSLVCYPISVAFLLWWLRHTIAHTDEATLR